MNQLDKNTVKAENQLKPSQYVHFERAENSGLRVLFIGNSITLHGEKPDIGWNVCWGMAASSKEKDYVHLLEAKISERHPDAVFCICQMAGWECNYKTGEDLLSKEYQAAADFAADVIVLRLVENCPGKDYDEECFVEQYKKLLAFMNPSGKANIILSTSFWKHPFDAGLRRVAEEYQLPLVELGDLGELDEMKAVGLFWHSGVAAHPGDLGMATIADRLWCELQKIL